MSATEPTGPPCQTRVGKGVVTYQCHLPLGHDGPHAAIENRPSMNERARWEEGKAARAILAEGQGPALSFWENRGEAGGGTPHPELRIPRLNPEGKVVDPRGPNEVPMEPVEQELDPTCPTCGHITEDFDNVMLNYGGGVLLARKCPACQQHFAPSSTVVSAPMPPEPTKQREGDQPLPIQSLTQPCIQDLLIDDIQARKLVGIERYGTVLQPFNGRDSVIDAYEEAVDLATYLRQVRYEHSVLAGRLREMADRVTAWYDGVDPLISSQELREMADVLEPPKK